MVIFDLKNFVANLVRFGLVSKKIAIFFSEKGAGGGSKAVRKFSGNSSIFEKTGFPKNRCRERNIDLLHIQLSLISINCSSILSNHTSDKSHIGVNEDMEVE